MTRTTRLLAAVALSGIFSGSVHAAPISTTITLTPSGDGSVGYYAFDVIGAGLFDIFTTGSDIDPELFLFEDDGSFPIAGALVDTNDDGCFDSPLCGDSGGFSNSLLSGIFLDVGGYVAAVGDYNLSETEARNGINDASALTTRFGNVDINVAANAADAGTAMASPRGSVPEPGSLALMAGGLLAGGFVGRRRRGAAKAA